MYRSTLTFLAVACGAVLASPTPARAAGAASLPLPARTIFQLDDTLPGSWFENVALRRNGDVLATMLQPNASVYSIKRPLSGSPEASIIRFADANGLLGIVETSPDVFAVASGTFGALATPVEGSMAVWELDFRGSEPSTRLIAKVPEAGILNGLASVPRCSSSSSSSSSSSVLLAADSLLGRVWRVDLGTGAYETAADLPEMKAVPGSALELGVNGLKARGGYLYFSNTNLASVFRLRLGKAGAVAAGASAELVVKFDTTGIDDFDIDAAGAVWVATNFDGTVAVAKPGAAAAVVVAGSPAQLTVAGDTAVAIGRSAANRNFVYVATGGAQGAPINGTVTEPAKIVVIDRTGF